MDLVKKCVMLHGRREMFLLTPTKLNSNISITADGKGDYFAFSNGTGYSYLSQVFALASSLQSDEILYLPLVFTHMNAFEDDFPDSMEKHYSGLIFFNYCTAQYTAKEIVSSIKTKAFRREFITRTCEFSSRVIDSWKTQHRTTIKESGPFFFVSTNADGFTSFAQSCANLAEYGDDAQHNQFPPHMHHDCDENTSKSLGITLYYWHSP